MKNKIRILFIGELISSHAQSWISLLDEHRDSFDVLGYGVPGSLYPVQGKCKMFPAYGRIVSSTKIPLFIKRMILDLLIRFYQPDIVHTFAAFPTCFYYGSVLKKHKDRIKWVAQVRGGPDLYINRFYPERSAVLREMFANCDVLIADNEVNYRIAEEMGASKARHWSYGVAPGTGGVDLADFQQAKKPSESEKCVIWPKAYEGYESKGLPVLEAIKIAWPHIAGTKFILTAVNKDLQDRLHFMPKEILNNIEILPRIPRYEMLRLMQKSRVVIAPSTLEGVPNALYESMAAQCVPIFSALETYADKFIDNENILYARNLYPHEIADALVRAINDDALADKIALNNVELVARIANRKIVEKNLITLYKHLSVKA